MEQEDNPWVSVSAPEVIDLTKETQVSHTGTEQPGTQRQATQTTSAHVGDKGLLLLVFIHGFKGSAETTFEDYPNRLSHVLRETHTDLQVKPVIYPTYDTRGSLATAVANFVEWLTMETLTLESKPLVDAETGTEVPYQQSGQGGGRGSVRIVLCGHSMGGLVAVDAALRIATDSMTEKDQNCVAKSLWPRVIGVLAYDSPYYGVHPNVFKNQASKYISYAQQARDVGAHFAPLGAGLAAAWGMNRSRDQQQQQQQQQTRNGGGWGRLAGMIGQQGSHANGNSAPPASTTASTSGRSGWTNALWATGVLATAATAGGVAAYYNREQIGGAYSYLTDHFQYVSNLWDDKALRERLDSLIELPSIFFHAYYNHLPASTTLSNSRDRTFVILPPRHSQASRMFTPLVNTVAADEIAAHISMFSSKENPSAYIELGRKSAELIDTVIRSESLHPGDQRDSQKDAEVLDGDQQANSGLRKGDAGLEEEEEEVKKMQRDQRAKVEREMGA
ncbi:unnamed protein product [Sympodiomycopsis kandeliae]